MTTDVGALRAGHAERQRAIELLKAAYADGRLDQDELEQRAGQALAARTIADLDTLLADLGAAGAVAVSGPPVLPLLPAERPVHSALEPLVRLVRCVLCCCGG